MKKYLIIFWGMFALTCSMAQKPVTWAYNAKKISDKVYEVHLKANIQSGWHLYAQEQSEDFMGSPTKVKFNKHPLIALSGKTAEVGKLEKSKDPVLEIESGYYTGEVDFVQRITLRNNSRTTISGSIEFQTCTDEKCLPPTIVSFSVHIN